MTTGFAFGSLAGSTTTTGFGATNAAASGPLNFAKPAATTASTGFNFGGTAQSTTTGGLGGLTTSTAKPGLSFGTTPAAGFGSSLTAGLGANGAKPAGTGLTLGAPGFGTQAQGFGSTTGLGLGQTKTTAATTGLAGFGAASTAAIAKPATFGGLTATTAASGGFSFGGSAGLGGLGSTGTAATGGVNIFSSPASIAETRGLGGSGPAVTAATVGGVGGSGSSNNNGKSGVTKAVKETPLPPEIASHAEEFKAFVKDQRNTSEEMDRVSSKQLYRIQEDVTSLKQMLMLVSTGLQKNALAIESMKLDSARELKSAEIAQRTKDLPPSLQYENTAPSEYFARMADDFEARMMAYRQHIEELESHLSSLNQPATLTPQELALLLKKISESFVHIAAQVHLVNEAVKVQKQQFLNYRKIFYGDASDIFEKRRKAAEKSKTKRLSDIVGPTPFTGMSNAAALAMASALNRQQQPGGMPSLGLNSGLGSTQLTGQSTGFGAGLNTGSIFGSTNTGATNTVGGLGAAAGFGAAGFGTTTTQASTGFGNSFNFGSSATGNTATVRPLGSTFTGGTPAGAGLFGATSATTSSGLFGNPTSNLSSGSTTAPGAVGFQQNNNNLVGFGQPDNKAPFLLQKPPPGNKKGKKV